MTKYIRHSLGVSTKYKAEIIIHFLLFCEPTLVSAVESSPDLTCPEREVDCCNVTMNLSLHCLSL